MADRVLVPPLSFPSVGAPPARIAGFEDFIVALLGILFAGACFFAFAAECRHPFIIPLMACGVLIGMDVVAWLRGRLDPFDPRALVALLMLHNVFIAPLLQQAWEVHTREWELQIFDWKPYLALYGLVNLSGIIPYKFAQRWLFRRTQPARTVWRLDDGRFLSAVAVAIGLSVVAGVIIIVQFGGLRREEHEQLMALGSGLQHLSWLLMLSDPFPILLAMLAVRFLARQKRSASMFTVILVLLGLAVTAFAFLGLRGSRSAFMYLLVIAAGMLHYQARRIPVRWALVGGLLLLVFVYYYGFFKRAGAAGFAALQSEEQRQHLEKTTGNKITVTLFGDLSRAEMQTFMIFRLQEHGDRYRFRRGWTYVRSALMVIPRAIWYDKGPGVTEAGTDLQYGEGRASSSWLSARVYGLAGEALLNFGYVGVPIMFFLFGALMGWYRRKVASWGFGDARFYIAPIMVIIAMAMYIGDSDNVMFTLLKNGTLPILVVFMSSRRVPLRAGVPA